MDSHIEAKINSYADRCFRDTGDKDYIHARLAFRHLLSPQFRWSALHCLEKYAKCILLINKIDGRKISHQVTESLNRIKAAGKFEVKISHQTHEFISRLENGAQHRYLESSWYVMEDDLARLDLAVAEIRRYCRVLDFEISTEKCGAINMFPHYLKMIETPEGTRPKNIPLTGGFLEKVIHDPRHPAREALKWENSFYADESPKTRLRYSESEISPFELHPDAIEELAKLIFIPKKIIMQLAPPSP